MEGMGFLLTVLWVIGIVVAKGFWMTLWSVLIPLVGWSEAVIWLMHRYA
jgi:hypothetical protein